MKAFRNATFLISSFFSLSQINVGFLDLYYFYILIIILFPILLLKYRTIDTGLLLVLLYLFFIGIINVLMQNNELFPLLKILLSVAVFYWLYYLILKDQDFKLTYFFKLYYKASLVVSCIGIIQFFAFLVGFKYGYDFGWLGLRQIAVAEMAGKKLYPIHSVLGEPAAYALVLAPTIYFVLDSLKNKSGNFLNISKREAYIILIPYLLTQSSTGYITLLFCLLLINVKKISFTSILAPLILLPVTVILLYSVSPKFQDRLDSSISLITGEIILDAVQGGAQANGSSLVLFNHFIIAEKNAIDHPFGTGLGSHHVAFFKYNTLQTYFTGYGPYSMILNLNDGSSLFTRILSEMGFIGIFFTLIFIFKNFERSGPIHLVLINHSSLVMIFTSLLRGGHYILFGLPFFILCYYYSAKFIKQDKNQLKSVPQLSKILRSDNIKNSTTGSHNR